MLQLPDLTVEVLSSDGPYDGGRLRDVPHGTLFLSSEPRRILEIYSAGAAAVSGQFPKRSLKPNLKPRTCGRPPLRFGPIRTI